MARDALDVLARLRDLAVDQASAALTAARGQETLDAARLDAQRGRIALEQSQAGGDVAAFMAWLPHARMEEARLQAALAEQVARVERCQQALLACRTDAEAVAKARARRRAEAELLQSRRAQAEMDEVASRSTPAGF